MSNHINRRRFIGSAVSASAFTLVPRSALGGNGFVSANDRITLAHIGVGTQGINEMGSLLEDPQIQIVAMCDPNKDSNDYIEWGKNNIRDAIRKYLNNPAWGEGRSGCPGGREVGREIVNGYYANHRGKENYQGCAVYADFRELLDKEKDVDAVKIMTPDHLHATISIAAMKKGKHVLMHKPIANRLREGRLVLETARQTKKATHLLAYGSGSQNGRIAELIKQGAIGKLREIHNWSNRPVWPQYSEIPEDKPPIPDGFDWDLWLGPEKARPYHPHYTHTVFRGWYDFGGGSMADMGIYSLWPVFAALNLESPASAHAWATHTCYIKDNISSTRNNDYSYPIACSLRFRFAAREDRPEMDLFWYDGGMKPRLPIYIEKQNVQMDKEGILFVGDDGAIMAEFHGQKPQLFRNGKVEPLPMNNETIKNAPREKRNKYWIRECLGGEASPGSFLNAAAITDAVNLGTIALRAEKIIEFDSEKMKITNVPDANQYLTREYREGWEL
ncbi:MAG: Gfo/Idh/MocA family oxidoreductase [Candidatus Omnitrophota bacterium]